MTANKSGNVAMRDEKSDLMSPDEKNLVTARNLKAEGNEFFKA